MIDLYLLSFELLAYILSILYLSIRVARRSDRQFCARMTRIQEKEAFELAKSNKSDPGQAPNARLIHVFKFTVQIYLEQPHAHICHARALKSCSLAF